MEVFKINIGAVRGKVTIDIGKRYAVQKKFVRLEHAVEKRSGGCALDNSFKGHVTFGGIFLWQFALEAFQTNILALNDKIHNLRRLINRAIQSHINHRRGNLEVLQAEDVAFQEVIARHAAEEDAAITAAIELDMTGDLRVVNGAGYLDGVGYVAGYGLVGRDECGNIFCADLSRVELQIDYLITRQADVAFNDRPFQVAVLLKVKLVYVDAVETT